MKNWKKPYVVEMSVNQLSTYIHAAARSGICMGRFGR